MCCQARLRHCETRMVQRQLLGNVGATSWGTVDESCWWSRVRERGAGGLRAGRVHGRPLSRPNQRYDAGNVGGWKLLVSQGGMSALNTPVSAGKLSKRWGERERETRSVIMQVNELGTATILQR